MFKRKDIRPLLLLLFLITLVMITLSQLLVHNHGRYGRAFPSARRKRLGSGDISANHPSPITNGGGPTANDSWKTTPEGRARTRLPLFEDDPGTRVSSPPGDDSSRIGVLDFSIKEMVLRSGFRSSERKRLPSPSDDRNNNNNNNYYYYFQDPFQRDFRGSEIVRTMYKNVRVNNCPEIPPEVSGKIIVTINYTHPISFEEVVKNNLDLKPGGAWSPLVCISKHRVAVIIPYRDREAHLLTLLNFLLPMLKRQQLDFRIVVVEQYGNQTFNKGRIMNAAFKEVLKINDFHCFIFHDVDLIPEDDRNMYSCPEHPRHLSVAIDEMEYVLAYELLVGGVLNLQTNHFKLVNGYSNLYWGWGAEDDDMAYRIINKGLKITRPPSIIARYKMIKHKKRSPASWRKRRNLLRTVYKRSKFDGLSNVAYKVIFIHLDKLFTHIMVDIGPPPKS